MSAASPQVKITKSEPAESAELLASSIVQVSEASKALLKAGLTEDALVTLLHRYIGPTYISRKQIQLVLDALPRLRGWYVKSS